MGKRSRLMTQGPQRAPHRSLLRAAGFDDRELERPIIGIANSFNEIIPGHMHLDKLVQAVKAGVYEAGGTPMVFNTIGICDGIAMNHEGDVICHVSRRRDRHDKKVTLITDGRFSGAARGTAIGHISPEATAKGSIAIVKDGDMIEIDIHAKKINLRLSDQEIRKRTDGLPEFVLKINTGYLARYAKIVFSADKGAVFPK